MIYFTEGVVEGKTGIEIVAHLYVDKDWNEMEKLDGEKAHNVIHVAEHIYDVGKGDMEERKKLMSEIAYKELAKHQKK